MKQPSPTHWATKYCYPWAAGNTEGEPWNRPSGPSCEFPILRVGDLFCDCCNMVIVSGLKQFKFLTLQLQVLETNTPHNRGGSRTAFLSGSSRAEFIACIFQLPGTSCVPWLAPLFLHFKLSTRSQVFLIPHRFDPLKKSFVDFWEPCHYIGPTQKIQNNLL